MWHFLAETAQQDATQGLNGRSTIRLPGHRRHAHHFTRQTATRADPRTKSQAARATFPRTQALSISTARPRQHSQHFEHQAFPTSPTRPQAARRRHARQAASLIPNSMSTKPPMPLPPGLSHFPEKAAALFHVEGKTRERQRVRNAPPPPEKEPAMVEQTFECSNCYEVFNKEHTTEVLWTQCPHCGGRAYPY